MTERMQKMWDMADWLCIEDIQSMNLKQALTYQENWTERQRTLEEHIRYLEDLRNQEMSAGLFAA